MGNTVREFKVIRHFESGKGYMYDLFSVPEGENTLPEYKVLGDLTSEEIRELGIALFKSNPQNVKGW